MNAENVTSVLYLYIFCAVIVSIFVAQILEKRLKERLPHTLPYRWGYYFGCITLGSTPLALLFAGAGITFAASGKAELFGEYLVYTAYFGIQGLCGWFIIKRRWWAWILGTIFSFNIVLWIINAIYGRNRRLELSKKSQIRGAPIRQAELSPSLLPETQQAEIASATESSEIGHRSIDIHFTCPHCSQRLSVDVRGAGILVNCPSCQEQIEIPPASPPPVPTEISYSSSPPIPAALIATAQGPANNEAPKHAQPQEIPSEENLEFAPIAPPETASKRKFALIGKVIGSWIFGVFVVVVIALVLVWGAKVAAWVQPWIEGLAGLTMGILVPLSLFLLMFRKTRAYGGLGIYLASYAIGLSLWVGCFLYAIGVSVFWTVAGIVMGGLGIVPVAGIMTLIRRDWSSFGSITAAVVTVYTLRWFGAWVASKTEQWNAEATIRTETFKARSTSRGNYFVRHWHGELSLGAAYWLSGIVAGFFGGLAAGVVYAVQDALSLRAGCALGLLLYALAIISTVWWYIGVWRSASNHFSRGGTRFWAGIAKAIVVLGFLGTLAATFRTYIPQSIEMLSIIAGDAGMPAYQIRVLPGGTDIAFRGGLRAGSARELQRILDAVPQAEVLQIESPGGRIEEAKRMMKLVREHGLMTYTSEECESAATLVLVSGKERVIGINAKVGFHAGTLPGITSEQQRGADDLVRSTMQSAGVSAEFIEKVLATPSDGDMWYPSFDEMLASGFATAQFNGDSLVTGTNATNSAPGSIYKAKGKVTQPDFALSQAIAHPQKPAKSEEPGRRSLARLAEDYRAAGNNEAAKQSYLQAIQGDPNSLDAVLSRLPLADIYLSEGDEKMAFELAYQTAASDPNPEAWAWRFLADWYFDHHRDEDGYRCFLNATNLSPQR